MALKLSHPRFNIPKIYTSIIDRAFVNWEKKKINKKVYIGQKEWGRASFRSRKNKWKGNVKLKLEQGKKEKLEGLCIE